MKNRWVVYLSALILVGIVVSISILLPVKLMNRHDRNLIGKITTVVGEPEPGTGNPDELGKEDSIENLYRKLTLIGSGEHMSTEYVAPKGNEMSMRRALLESERQLMYLIDMGVLSEMILDYTGHDVIARMVSLQEPEADFRVSYWQILYSIDNNGFHLDNWLSIVMDAETGKIYSLEWNSIDDEEYSVDIKKSGKQFANYLNIQVDKIKIDRSGSLILLSPDARFIIGAGNVSTILRTGESISYLSVINDKSADRGFFLKTPY